VTGEAASAPDDPLVLRVAPELAAIPAAGDAADAHVAARGAGERARYAVRLVLEEILANVVLHASARADVEVAVRADGPAIVLRIADDGIPFDPTSVAPPADPDSLETARVGGLGIAMVRAAARRMSWRRDGGRNVLDVEIALDDAARKG
jgi:serine/threonine-protein kinase RsbW